MESTSEDIAILISVINSRVMDGNNVSLDLATRKETLESALHSFSELSSFTRFRYRRYLPQRIAELKNEIDCIKDEKVSNEHSLRTDLLNLIRKLLLVYSNEIYAVSKKQRNVVWENLSEWLGMDQETFIRYTNQCGCVV